MTTNHKLIPNHDEDSFEFVDYSSVSSFERLTTAIEEVLLSWGINNHSYGVFADEVLPTLTEYSTHSCISFGAENYKLTYYCHPHVLDLDLHSSASSVRQPLLLHNYYQFEPPSPPDLDATNDTATTTTTAAAAYHPLHRWTGLSHLILLAPLSSSTTQPKLFTSSTSSTTSIDHRQVKVLLNACAIAFSNVHCFVPIFISEGQPRHHGIYSGYSLQRQHDRMNLELRFNTKVISPAPRPCSMDYLQASFIEQVNGNRLDNGLLPLAPTEKLHLLKGAVLTYELKNRFNANWKHWNDDDHVDTGTSTSQVTTARLHHQKRSHLLPELSFGSYNDPLRTMNLSALFPFDMDQHHHHHAANHDAMLDAFAATYWDLTLEFAPSSQKRALLSTLLDNAIASWINDVSSYRDYALDPHHLDTTAGGGDESMGRRRSTRLMQNILHVIGQNKGDSGGSTTTTTTTNKSTLSGVIQAAKVDAIVKALFKSNDSGFGGDDDGGAQIYGGGGDSDSSNNNNKYKRNSNSMDYIKLRNANADLSLLTPWSLSSRLKFGTSVPRRSFLWNLVVYQMDVLQKLDISGQHRSLASIGIDLLQVCWAKILRQLRWHWENLIPIPNVNPFMYTQHNDSQNGVHLGVDLGYSIVHQKLAMINCCIHQSIEELPTDDHASPPLTSKHKNSASLFKDLQDIRTINRDNDDILVDKYSSISIGTKNERPKSCATHSDISESDLYDSMYNNSDNNGTTSTVDQQQRTRSSRREITKAKNQPPPPPSCSSWSSSISDVSDLIHPAAAASSTSLQESFVGLNYSTSAESDPCQYVPGNVSETDDWSTSIHKSPPELQDPNAFEGRSYQHESILLLKSKTPLWVPVTQNSGFMTEDMIQQQADTFESLGTSDNATHLRAKLQSAQLESDMQAFKAANPHAVLGDFVRWYSPKDWVEDDKDPSKGRLSARMSHPTNIWQELWKCSPRIPASRQPSLFNLTAEGEKALYYLEHLPIHELFSLLLPTMGLIVYDVLASHPIVKYIRPLAIGLNHLATELINFPWDMLRNGTVDFGSLVSRVKQEESLMCNAISLLRKIPKNYDLVERLLVDYRVRLKDDDERTAIFNLYKDEDNVMPKPACTEYVFYMNSSPSIDHPLPQRQYILLKDNKLRQLDMCSVEMWRKEQHFITTQKHSNHLHLLDNNGTMGPWCEKQISSRTPTNCGQAKCYDGHRMYGGHEFDIFGGCNVVVQANGDEQWHSNTLSTTTTTIPNSNSTHLSSSPQWTDKFPRSPTATHHHHHDSMKTNTMKRKNYQDERSTLEMVEKKNKRCCSAPTTTTTLDLDTNNHYRSRPSVLRTHFFLHTTPSGAPIDLFKPVVDTSNCFCTQHAIYS